MFSFFFGFQFATIKIKWSTPLYASGWSRPALQWHPYSGSTTRPNQGSYSLFIILTTAYLPSHSELHYRCSQEPPAAAHEHHLRLARVRAGRNREFGDNDNSVEKSSSSSAPYSSSTSEGIPAGGELTTHINIGCVCVLCLELLIEWMKHLLAG
jgi:hypothetical protein